MFELDPGLMIWTVISFFLLVVLLKKLAYKPLLEVLENRENSIRQSLEDSEKARTDANNLVKEHQKQLMDVKTEVKKMLDEGRNMGEEVRKDIVVKAQGEAEQILQRARAEITNEKEKALKELQSEVADLSIQIASKVINKALSKEEHITIVTDCISEVNNEQ